MVVSSAQISDELKHCSEKRLTHFFNCLHKLIRTSYGNNSEASVFSS